MKRKIVTTTTLLASLIGISQMAQAEGEKHQFTPIENLAPETRQAISARVYDLTKGLEIDWDQVVVGVNENGEIALRAKSAVEPQSSGSFSCAAPAAAQPVDKDEKQDNQTK